MPAYRTLIYFPEMMTTRRWLVPVMLIIAALGAVDAGYLASLSLSGALPVCNFIKGCHIVATSPYSKIFGIPLALFGFFFYITAFGLLVALFQNRTRLLSRFLIAVTFFGFIASLYFMYLEAFVILAWCEYCIFSAVLSTLLFALTLIYFRKDFDTKVFSLSSFNMKSDEEKRSGKTVGDGAGLKPPRSV